MRFFASLAIVLPTLFTGFRAQASILPRFLVEAGGAITQPPVNSTISAGETFPFHYSIRNFCNAGYSPITIWLLESPPTSSEIVLDGGLGSMADGDYLYSFGTFLAPNFGLPAMSTPQPPSSLTMPELDASVADGQLFLVVIETYEMCPPDGHEDVGLTYIGIDYDGSA